MEVGSCTFASHWTWMGSVSGWSL